MLRLQSLDSLRGIAAIIVVMHHVALIVPGLAENRQSLLANGFAEPNSWLYLTPLKLLVSGPAAVLVFFVLSGLVLSLTSIRRDHDSYPVFMIKRVTRIWPPFAFSILASMLLAILLRGRPAVGAYRWIDMTWSDPASIKTLVSHLLMLGNSITLNVPMWSLVHEMRVSVIFPLLVWATVANWRMSLGFSVALALAIGTIFHLEHMRGTLVSVMMTMVYLFTFVAGIAIALHLNAIRARVSALSSRTHGLLWAVALFGICCAPYRTHWIGGLTEMIGLLVSSAGAALIVILCASEGRAFQALTGRVPAYLGRISYSLYLLHMVVFAAMLHAFSASVPLIILLPLAVGISIIAADLSQRFIETPATDAGRRLARRWGERHMSSRRPTPKGSGSR